MFFVGVPLRDLRASKKPADHADHAESVMLRQRALFRFIRKFFGCGFAALGSSVVSNVDVPATSR
jgi:hypothetical protein